MFEEMKIRHLLGLIAIIFVPTIIILTLLLMFSIVEFEIISVAMGIVLYVIVPLIFFGYHFRKQNVSIRQVVYTKGVLRWTPSLFVIVIISIAFSISAFWLYLYLLSPVLPSLVDFLLEEMPMPESGILLAFEIIMITILAPIVE